jgi:DNA primase
MLVSYGSGPFPVLTEDILSAYKIGLVGEGWPAMGTNVPDAYVAEFMRRRRPVAVWLDPDGPGRKAAARYTKQLRAYGLTVIDIRSEKDPKLHTIEEIRATLHSAI